MDVWSRKKEERERVTWSDWVDERSGDSCQKDSCYREVGEQGSVCNM